MPTQAELDAYLQMQASFATKDPAVAMSLTRQGRSWLTSKGVEDTVLQNQMVSIAVTRAMSLTPTEDALATAIERDGYYAKHCESNQIAAGRVVRENAFLKKAVVVGSGILAGAAIATGNTAARVGLLAASAATLVGGLWWVRKHPLERTIGSQ